MLYSVECLGDYWIAKDLKRSGRGLICLEGLTKNKSQGGR